MYQTTFQSHERPVTQIKFNRDGDLLFTTSKDKVPNIYFTYNAERLGTLEGHKGAVWCLDVDNQTEKVITGSADDTLAIWSPMNGQILNRIEVLSSVRTCNFGAFDNLVLMTTDTVKGQPCEIMIYDIRDLNKNNQPVKRIKCPRDAKVVKSLWGPQNINFVTAHEDGNICRYDMRADSFDVDKKVHNGLITDMQHDSQNDLFITSSKDKTAKLFDFYEMNCWKTYSTDRPLNSASISHVRPHICLGGGQDAASVALTSAAEGKFEAIFLHQTFETQFSEVGGNIGPINSVAFHPNDLGFATGNESGLVKFTEFNDEYFNFKLNH